MRGMHDAHVNNVALLREPVMCSLAMDLVARIWLTAEVQRSLDVACGH